MKSYISPDNYNSYHKKLIECSLINNQTGKVSNTTKTLIKTIVSIWAETIEVNLPDDLELMKLIKTFFPKNPQEDDNCEYLISSIFTK